ncbi:hypothetical protein GCM10009823_04300 [Brevibacterium salitolerans]|uniref:Uncharacterized protein n=1 Tax=Brevibacterium salitolerans TaxID=1403566 RepID=A0ABP5HY19_9MICO
MVLLFAATAPHLPRPTVFGCARTPAAGIETCGARQPREARAVRAAACGVPLLLGDRLGMSAPEGTQLSSVEADERSGCGRICTAHSMSQQASARGLTGFAQAVRTLASFSA